MTLDDFEEQVISACTASPVVESVSLTVSSLTWIRLSAYLFDGTHLEAFYNDMAGKASYALIKEDQHIFGADNTGNWHWHPFETPDQHIATTEAINFQVFLKEIEDRLR